VPPLLISNAISPAATLSGSAMIAHSPSDISTGPVVNGSSVGVPEGDGSSPPLVSVAHPVAVNNAAIANAAKDERIRARPRRA
jgi:hypothetical protein